MEIKFRGKRSDKKGWDYGYYIKHLGIQPSPMDTAPLDSEYKHYLMMDGTADWRMERNTVHCEVIPETVGQFTGIKDKNGKEIYEGDIVKCHKFTQELGENLGVYEGEKEFIAKISFSIYGGTQVELVNGNFMFVWEFEEGWHEESLEVIGNIYDNPELLGG